MPAQGYHRLITPEELAEAAGLLKKSGLNMPEGIDSGLGFYEDGRLSGTAFLADNLICGVCTDEIHRGQGLASSLVGRLLAEALHRGSRRVCIFTKAQEADTFTAMGFQLVASSSEAALLEFGTPNYASWMQGVRETVSGTRVAASCEKDEILGAVVMNANPFTLGHRALVKEATDRCAQVLVFVVEEEASAFSFADRLHLVRAGVADMAKAIVLPAGPYIVSRASFPSYFTGKAAHAAVHAVLDATIFASRIAPDLGISIRFVGEEPYCQTTAAYNEALRKVLPEHGVSLCEIRRKTSAGGVISASKVRELMRTDEDPDRITTLSELVPKSTMDFLLSDKGQDVTAILRQKTGRH